MTYMAWPVADVTRPGLAGTGIVWRVDPERPYQNSTGRWRTTGRIVTSAHLGRVMVWPCDTSGVVAPDDFEFGVTAGSDHVAAVRAAGFTPTVEAETAS